MIPLRKKQEAQTGEIFASHVPEEKTLTQNMQRYPIIGNKNI